MRTQTAKFVEEVAALRFPHAFNPYADTCVHYDLPDAPRLRSHNLRLVLDAAVARGVRSVWIGRDLGYRGGRRTGLALTDEAHLKVHAELFGISRPGFVRSTHGPPLQERTAAVVWRMLLSVQRPVFLWNLFPLHPHLPDSQMTNRAHTKPERRAGEVILLELLRIIKPKTILAIGRDAQLALQDMGIQSIQVRHPSYGGLRDFVKGVEEAYVLEGHRRNLPDQPNLL